MRSKQNSVIYIEGILHIARRVIRREVELCKAVVVIFDFGAVKHCKAETYESIAYLSVGLCHGVYSS